MTVLSIPADELPPEAIVTTDLTLILPDEIGSLARAFAAFSNAGVAIRGSCGFPAWAGEGILHVLVDDIDGARHLLHAAGIAIREERELLLTRPLADSADATRVLEQIAAANVNVDLIYQLGDGSLAIGVNRLDVGRRAIGSLAAGSAAG